MTEDKDKSSKGQWHGGKGSIQKPSNQDKYAENYDKIFNSNKKKTLSKRERILMNPPLFKTGDSKNDNDS
tara:strand:+ start:3978 stop:4187 length:210 start_codon:yes stop_codon:yes gene_type:complete